MVNPYEYDPSLDEDIFTSDATKSSHKHSMDGEVCSSCGVIHDPMPEDLPDDIVERIMSIFDVLPDALARKLLNTSSGMRTPRYVSMMMNYLEFSSDLDEANTQGPLLRAIVEVLDEQTNGLITARWRAYEVERRILTSHMARKAANEGLEEAQEQETDTESIVLLKLARQFMEDRIAFLAPIYIEEAERAGVEARQSIIDEGEYGDINETSRTIMLDEMMSELNE